MIFIMLDDLGMTRQRRASRLQVINYSVTFLNSFYLHKQFSILLAVGVQLNTMGFPFDLLHQWAGKKTLASYIHTRCGHVVRDFESEAKTRCNYQHWFYEIFKNDNVQGLRSKFRKIVVDPLFFGQRIIKGCSFIFKLKEI